MTVPAEILMVLRRVVETLPRYSYRFDSEATLHRGIAEVLAANQVPFAHEHVAGPRDRFDFLVEPGIVIEAKVNGSLSPAIAQSVRYLERADVTALVIVTTRFWGLQGRLRPMWKGKPMRMVKLSGTSF